MSEFFDSPERDGEFAQTQFANTPQPYSVCFVASEKYRRQANENPNITCVVTSRELAGDVDAARGLVVTENPEKTFYQLHNRLITESRMRPALEPGIHPDATIHPAAHIDEYVSIGARTEIGPGAVVLEGSILEQDVLVGPNAVVGADAHFYKRYDGHIFRVQHAGGVLLEEGVQVLAGGVISKALHTDFTVVGCESVISIQAHVGHGCQVGRRCLIGGNAQISGYSRIGDDVWIAPSATVGNLINIGNGAAVETGSVVVESVKDGARVSGNYAISHGANMMDYARKKRALKRK